MLKSDCQKFLDSLGMFGWKLELDRIAAMADSWGNPQNSYPAIHIAGTNGKGSVARILENFYREQGYKTGLYTSPHLVNPVERIAIAGEEISEAEFETTLSELEPTLSTNKATYFEALTLLAFVVFRAHEIDLAIIEVGLGGRFDATNIVKPVCSVITSISLDHTDHLGAQIDEIATEKAGIIKRGTPCVVGELPGAALEKIKEVCDANSAGLTEAQQAINLRLDKTDSAGMSLTWLDKKKDVALRTKISGRHQLKNIKTAIAVTKVLQDNFYCSIEAIERAFACLQLRGRFQTWNQSPRIIVDVAHNEESMYFLRTSLVEIFGDRQCIFILGLLADKNISAVGRQLIPLRPYVYCVTPNSPRALTAAALQKKLQAFGIEAESSEVLETAFSKSVERSETESIIVICGSHFVAGQFLSESDKFHDEIWKKEKNNPAVKSPDGH